MTAAISLAAWNDMLTREQTFKSCAHCGNPFWALDTRHWCDTCLGSLYYR